MAELFVMNIVIVMMYRRTLKYKLSVRQANVENAVRKEQ
jgi:hypothetical protein